LINQAKLGGDMQFPDTTLIEGVLSKDKKAFEMMYETYFPKIYNYTFFHVGEKKLAEQMTEEIFIELVGTLDQYTKGFSLDQWIFRITRRHMNPVKSRQKKGDAHPIRNEDISLTDFFKFEEALLAHRHHEVIYGG